MSDKFQMVKEYLMDMDLEIVREDTAEEIVIVEDDDRGIHNLIIDCEAPLVVMEQMIMPAPDEESVYKRLMQMNRSLIHGAFVLDDEGKYIFFRDTLQLENLDFNELEGSIQALSLAMAENADELVSLAKS